MTKADLINEILKNKKAAKLSKKATGELLDTVFDTLAKAIKKDRRFSYPGFGTFVLKNRKARVGRNPRTNEKIKIPPSKTVAFKPSPDFKKVL